MGIETLSRAAQRPAGQLEVRLARNDHEIREAQRLRYRVFYEEGGAQADGLALTSRHDADAFDAVCDHLLVLDHAAPHRPPAVVGTYRLLRQDMAKRHCGFYSEAEFDIGALTARHPALRFLELGRSCVLAPYRNRRVLDLLWQGIAAYAAENRPDVMIGCASLEGTDPRALALPLSFLHHFASAPEEWRAQAVPSRHIDMNLLPRDAVDPAAALRALPPLIRAYLRLGAYAGHGAAIDRQFGTTDVLIVLPVARIEARFLSYFAPSAASEAA